MGDDRRRRYRMLINAMNRRCPDAVAEAISGLSPAETASVVLLAVSAGGVRTDELLAVVRQLLPPDPGGDRAVPVSRV